MANLLKFFTPLLATRGRYRLLLLLLFPLLGSAVTAQAEISREQRAATYRQLEIFANVLSILQENYVEEIDAGEVLDGAMRGLLYTLDPHSSYLPPEGFQELQEETRGSFSGIGIEVTIKDDRLTVVTAIVDTPADRAGILPGDVIVEIDGSRTKNMGHYDAIKKLRGPPGKPVTITILRKGAEGPEQLTMNRAMIPLQSVRQEVLSPGLVYMRITNFQSHTAGDFKTSLEQQHGREPIKGLILDLRNNPGGLLHQAVSVADIFLRKGTIVSTRGRRPDQNAVFSAHSSGQEHNYPLVVLVNEGSASAAEIVAGAIQAHHRGIIVGSQTFGKGSVQTIIPLPDGAGLRMTTATYYTPDNQSIQARGIIPDVDVPFVACRDSAPEPAAKTIVKEVELSNHLPGREEREGESEEGSALEKRLSKDNQLRTAYNILKSLNLYSQFREKG